METKEHKKVEKMLKNMLNYYTYAHIAHLNEDMEVEATYITFEKLKSGVKKEDKLKSVFTIAPQVPQFLRMMFETLLTDLQEFKGRQIPLSTFLKEMEGIISAAWLLPPHTYNVTVLHCEVQCDTSILKTHIMNILDVALAEACTKKFDMLIKHMSYIFGSLIHANNQVINAKLFIGVLNMLTMDNAMIEEMRSNIREPKKKAA